MSNRLNSKMGVIALIARAGLSSLAAGAGLSKAVTLAGVALASAVAVHAQSNVDGAIYGTTGLGNGQGTISLESSGTGVSRTLTPTSTGSYRAGSLPPGLYKVTFTPSSGAPQVKDAMVSINSSTLIDFSGPDVTTLERFVVSGQGMSPVDFQKTTASTVLTKTTIDQLPIARNTTAVALLTPGTVAGDSQFNLIGVGRLASFGGASVAENAYYVNGFNLTNFRNGLGGSTVPFDFYDQFEVINGAYSAEYGRSTGGVINATTKRGSNEFHSGINLIYRPDSLRSDSPDVNFKGENGADEISIYNGKDSSNVTEFNVNFSGPLIKDKLFVYAIFNGNNSETLNVTNSGTNLVVDKNTDPFWGLKLDAVPLQGHQLEYTFFSDKTSLYRRNYNYNPATDTQAATPLSTQFIKRGGENHIGRYTGIIADGLTFSALYGKGTFDRTNDSLEARLPFIQDARGAFASAPRTLQGVSSFIQAVDEREAWRADLEYAFELLGSHRLRVGYDLETNSSSDISGYGGGQRWRYVSVTPGRNVLNTPVPVGVTQMLYRRIFRTQGNFEVESEAFYLEDNWSLLDDRLLLRIGGRAENFENLNGAGATFLKVTEQYSPRLGASFDLFDNKRTKVYANYGRYYLPVASNTNIRLSGGEFDEQTYFFLDAGNPSGLDANGVPLRGAQFAQSLVSDGEVPDTSTLVAKNLKPMFQDEFMVGFQHGLTNDWTVGVRGIYRDLGSAFDDAIIDQGLNAYAARNGLPDQTDSFHYVLLNPGKDLQTAWDFGDGVLRDILIPAKDLGYPEASRKYYSVSIEAEKIFDGTWGAQFSYTWAHNYGNTEGLVLSDNGQTDAGITVLFDTPDLVVNTYGNLPNDRRHVFKASGTYGITKELTVGVNSSLYSGKPINRIGYVSDSVADFYGASYLLSPRGSNGETSWTFNADLSLVYRPVWGQNKLTFQVDVFNVLGRDGVTAVDEYFTTDEDTKNYSYLTATDFQQSRYVQFRTSINF